MQHGKEALIFEMFMSFSRLFEAKKEAAHSVELMRERYNGICSDETAKNGLIIVVALYGKLLNGNQIFTTRRF